MKVVVPTVDDGDLAIAYIPGSNEILGFATSDIESFDTEFTGIVRIAVFVGALKYHHPEDINLQIMRLDQDANLHIGDVLHARKKQFER